MTPENLLHILHNTRKCTLGCAFLDQCLAGGIPCNSVTELVAESGCGKTQLCLQLVLCAQLPLSNGGLYASSLYIYTEFPFPFRRLHQLSGTFRSSHSNLFRYDPCDQVFLHGVHSADQLLDLLPKIESFLKNQKSEFRTRLIVIDSIAALFRSEFENNPKDLKRRSSLFFKISGKLKSLAKSYGLAVVVTNQVVDVIEQSDANIGLRMGNWSSMNSSGRRVSPALGISWANCVNSRVFLSRNAEPVEEESGSNQSRRFLNVVFAPHLPKSSCEFVITRNGVVGVES